MKSDCPFCSFSEDARMLESTKLCNVFMSNPRMTAGHLLVSPTRHVWKPWELDHDEELEITRLLNKYRQKLESVFGEGSDIRQQYRPFAADGPIHNIRHLHYHILPRQLNDSIYQSESEVPLSKPLTGAEADRIFEQLQ